MGKLNGGLLPDGYYALSEQLSSGPVPDLLTLHLPDPDPSPSPPAAVYRAQRRTVTIRHTSGHRVVAFLEVISPGNKDRAASLEDFVTKVDLALTQGVHVMIADLFPPGRYDPQGIHGAIWTRYGMEEYVVPSDKSLTVASYRAVAPVEAYKHMAFGDPLPEMPLFLDFETYINVPLESTYQTAFQYMPAFWRDRLDMQRAAT
jgi:hypothetical protein